MEAEKLATIDDLLASPDERAIIAYLLDDGRYRVVFSTEHEASGQQTKVRIPPFESVEIDLDDVFGTLTSDA
jgi:hypothetical protein